MSYNKIRRTLNKAGYGLIKSRSRINFDNLGGYMIIDNSVNAVVAGSRYELTLDDVLDFISQYC